MREIGVRFQGSDFSGGAIAGPGMREKKDFPREAGFAWSFFLMGGVLSPPLSFYKTPPPARKRVESSPFRAPPSPQPENPPAAAAAATSSPGQVGASRE